MASEKSFENKIKRYLKDKGCYRVKYHGNYFSENGTPDILACVNGYFLACGIFFLLPCCRSFFPG